MATVTAEVGTIAARLAGVRARISAAGGDPAQVTIVAVTKGFGASTVLEARAAGLVDLGESYARELLGKAPVAPDARWHFVGRLQRNKVGSIAHLVHLWHSVDRPALGDTISRHAPGASVLVQVNVSGEPGKAGCRPEDTAALVDRLAEVGLDVRGLMAVGPAGPPELARAGFGWLAATARRLGLTEVSMGMTADLEVAVQEGSTMVRVGKGLFGPRPHRSATIGSTKEGS